MTKIIAQEINRDGHDHKAAFILPLALAATNIFTYFCFPVESLFYKISICLTDAYLMAMLGMAANCSFINANMQHLLDHNGLNKKSKGINNYLIIYSWYGWLEKYIFPTRLQGALTFPSMLLILIVGFAGVYITDHPNGFEGNPLENDKVLAVYISFQTMGLNDFKPCPSVRWVVIWQLFSAILFLTALFPLYISRISDLDTYKVTIIDDVVVTTKTTNLRDAIIKLHESNKNSNEDSFNEYMKALDAIDYIDNKISGAATSQKNTVITELLNKTFINQDEKLIDALNALKGNFQNPSP